MTTFNAWRDPWVPVRATDGPDRLVSLRDLFAQIPDHQRFGRRLTPLDLDSLYRLVISLGAVIAREIKDDDWEDEIGQFPEYAVDAFGDHFEPLFDLTGDTNGGRPFLQRWDRSPSDIEALLTRQKTLQDVLLPIDQLHPHEPGGSSSKWTVRRESRSAADLPILVQLLTTSWFQTKNGNGQDPWGGKHLKGSSGTWHTNPFAIYYTDEQSLGRTVWANIPAAWVDGRNDLPVYLEHENLPEDFVTAGLTSVSRFSYAKTLPLVYFNETGPLGFVLGADTTVPVPNIGNDLKDSLGRVHEQDHTRLRIAKTDKTGKVTYVPRGSFGGRLSSTEGFERWFRAENNIVKALRDWNSTERILEVGDADRTSWTYSLHSETTDGKGTRTWAAWDTMPAAFAAADGDLRASIQSLLSFAAECRKAMSYAAKLATGESTEPAMLKSTQAAFYNQIEDVLADLSIDVTQARQRPMDEYALEIVKSALRVFSAGTEPLLTPVNVANVANGRGYYRRAVHKSLHRTYPNLRTDQDSESEMTPV